MQISRPVIALQPVFDKGGTAGGVARFEKAVDALMRCMGIARVSAEGSLDQPGPGGNLPGFDVGPAEVAEKPPIIIPVRRQFFKQRQLRLVMVAPAAETQKAKHPEREGQRERVSRIVRGVRMNHRQRLDCSSLDGQRNCLDVSSLPRGHAAAERFCPRRCRLGLRYPRTKLQQAGACDVGQRKGGIDRKGALQLFFSAEIGRE